MSELRIIHIDPETSSVYVYAPDITDLLRGVFVVTDEGRPSSYYMGNLDRHKIDPENPAFQEYVQAEYRPDWQPPIIVTDPDELARCQAMWKRVFDSKRITKADCELTALLRRRRDEKLRKTT